MKTKLFPVAALAIFLGACSSGDTTTENSSEATEPETKTETIVKDEELSEISIGDQVWSARNLSVTKFKNGDPIPQAKSKEEWVQALKEKKPAWCYFDYNPEHGVLYGRLYNWYAVKDKRGLAPAGWHIPGKKEFETLTDFLGGTDVAGGKMKSKSQWSDDTNGTNESGFDGLPGGYCNVDGDGYDLYLTTLFWSTDMNTDSTAYAGVLYANAMDEDLKFAGPDNSFYTWAETVKRGFYIRCVKDK